MPNIRTYDNKLQGPNADDRGANARANEAYHVGSTFHRIGQDIGSDVSSLGHQYVQHEERLETTRLGADLATAHGDLAVAWNEIASKTNPNDIEKARTDFIEKVANPRLDKIGESLETEGGQDMFARASAGLRDDLFVKTAADTAHIQGVGAVSNVLTMKNQLTAAVFADPTSFDGSMTLAKDALAGMQGAFGLPATDRIKLEQDFFHDLAKSAAIGMLQRNPTQGKIDVADGRFDKYLSGEELAQLGAHADSLVKAQETADKAKETEFKRQQKEAADQVANQITGSMLRPDGTLVVGPTTARDAVNYSMMPGVSPGEGRAMIDMVARVAKPDAAKQVSDPHTYEDLTHRMLLPSTDANALTPAQIYRAVADGKLSQKDASFIKGALDTLTKDPAGKAGQKQVDDFLKGMKSTITKSNPMMGTLDGQGDRNFYDFSVNARAEVAAGIAKGEKLTDILNRVRATVPRYALGLKGALPVMQHLMQGGAPNMTPISGGGAARKPGESAADYLKRVGGG